MACTLDVLCMQMIIILLSATVYAYRKCAMLFFNAASDLMLAFNYTKSVCTSFAPTYSVQISDIIEIGLLLIIVISKCLTSSVTCL